MASLEEQVGKNACVLKSALDDLQSPLPSTVPLECNELWKRRAELHKELDSTSKIFPARFTALEMIKDLSRKVPKLSNTTPNKNNIYADYTKNFIIERHLSFVSYVATTWSIYDRLANVCGRLVGTSEFQPNPRANPKLNEDFLNKDSKMGFSIQHLIFNAYARPIKISYYVRNWLVHEGYERESIPLFSRLTEAEPFLLHTDAMSYIEKTYNEEKNHLGCVCCCLNTTNDPWATRDLVKILDSYHNEIDTMFIALLQWSVDSFVGQVKAFAR